MSDEVLRPYEGPPPTAENFMTAFPQWESFVKGKKGNNSLDPESQNSLDAVHARMRRHRPKPVTLLNYHPWPLRVSGGKLFQGITVPACPPGTPFVKFVFRGYKTDFKPNQQGGQDFEEILPIQLAQEFVRCGTSQEMYGPGILIYEGEGDPLKVKEVEVYDNRGVLITEPEPGWTENPEGQREPTVNQVPVMRSLEELMRELRHKRNDFYLAEIRRRDIEMKMPNARQSAILSHHHFLMVDVLVAEGILTKEKIPQWTLTTKFEEGLSSSDCKNCGATKKETAISCKECGHIFKPLEALKEAVIQWGHASLEKLSEGELEEAYLFHLETEKKKRKIFGVEVSMSPTEDAKHPPQQHSGGKVKPSGKQE